MCPNWMGVRQQAFDRAALLAQDRYVVFVADMYGEGVRPKDFGEAAALAKPAAATIPPRHAGACAPPTMLHPARPAARADR